MYELFLIVLVVIVISAAVLWLMLGGKEKSKVEKMERPPNRGSYYSGTLGCMVEDRRTDAEVRADEARGRRRM